MCSPYHISLYCIKERRSSFHNKKSRHNSIIKIKEDKKRDKLTSIIKIVQHNKRMTKIKGILNQKIKIQKIAIMMFERINLNEILLNSNINKNSKYE